MIVVSYLIAISIVVRPYPVVVICIVEMPWSVDNVVNFFGFWPTLQGFFQWGNCNNWNEKFKESKWFSSCMPRIVHFFFMCPFSLLNHGNSGNAHMYDVQPWFSFLLLLQWLLLVLCMRFEWTLFNFESQLEIYHVMPLQPLLFIYIPLAAFPLIC